MKAAQFEYHAPTTLDEAVATLAEHGDDAKVLAGGQSLVPVLALRLARFGHLVDLNRVAALDSISSDGSSLSVGSMARQAAVGRAAEVAALAPLVARAIPLIGHFQIRNRGTLGGSISHADPASELPAVACALGATMELRSRRGPRFVDAEAYFTSIWETAAEADEILVAVHFPHWGAHSGYAIEEVNWRPGDFAVTGVAVALSLGASSAIERVRVAFLGMGPTPMRADAAEAALVGHQHASIDFDALTELALGATSPVDDVHAPASYRRRVAGTLLRRALDSALEEAARA